METIQRVKVQYTLEMVPAEVAPPRHLGKIERSYLLTFSGANIVDQLRMVDQEGNTKSEITEKSLRVMAKLVNHAGSISEAEKLIDELTGHLEKPL